MGLEVIRIDEDGHRAELLSDPKNLLHRLLPPFSDRSFPLLRFVDWYGNTIFNRMQVEELLGEWRRLYERAQSDEERQILGQIEALARRCLEEPHLYLKFEGD